MSAPFFAVDSERWPRMLARLRTLGPLEEDDARADLRYLENEHRVWMRTEGKRERRGSQFPGRVLLAARWGWSEKKTRGLLAADDWKDPINPVAAEDLRQAFNGKRANDGSNGGPAEGPTTDPTTVQTNADNGENRANDGSSPGPTVGPTRGPSRERTSEPHSTTEPQNHTGERAPRPPKPDEAAALWSIYRQLRLDLPVLDIEGRKSSPRLGLTPTPDGRKAMSRILTECEGLERAGIYLAWVHQSRDEWALRLRGEARWPDGKIATRLDPVSLSRSIPGRLAEAEAWEARGRSEARGAARRRDENAPLRRDQLFWTPPPDDSREGAIDITCEAL
jgi:hypothetical protein